MGIENSWGLPPEQAQLASSTTFGWDEIRGRPWCLRLGRSIGRQQMAQEGTRQPQSHHVPEKGPPIRQARDDAVYPLPQGCLIETHDSPSSQAMQIACRQ